MTKKEKLERFDAVKATADKNELAVHDLVNGRFSMAVSVRYAGYGCGIASAVGSGTGSIVTGCDSPVTA